MSLLSHTEPARTLTNIYDREIRIEFNNYLNEVEYDVKNHADCGIVIHRG